MSEYIPQLETKDDFEKLVNDLHEALEKQDKWLKETKHCNICNRTCQPNVMRLERYGKEYDGVCYECFQEKCHKEGMPKKFIEEQAKSLLEYRKERTLYSPCYSFLPWLEDNEIDIIKKKADELEKKEEQRKANEYKSSLLKEAADFCDRVIGKQQEDETITRGQLEDIIANLFGEFDKLKNRIDGKADREMIFR